MASILVAPPLSVAKAFSPGHITGFFEIPSNTGSDILQRGSRGAGFSIDKGITTSVQIYGSTKPGYEIQINGRRSNTAEVSTRVIEEYFAISSKPFFVKVEHDISIPVGFGLGSSGAAALSLSYALNKALDTGLSTDQAAQVAHKADIMCRTGLGTVIAEYAGGFEMRMQAGAPGVGSVSKIDASKYKAVILCIAPISTKSFLANRRDEINGLGGKMLSRLSESRSVSDFMKMSRDFADTLGLLNGRCRAPINALSAAGFDASVALFGETVFTLVPSEISYMATDALAGFGGTLLVCEIDSPGARVL